MAVPLSFNTKTSALDFAGPGRTVEIKADAEGEFARRQMLLTVNNWTFSVIWGFGTYCTNGRFRFFDGERAGEVPTESPDAEVMVWKDCRKAIDLHGETVEGWISPASLLAAVAAAESDDEDGIRAALVGSEEV